MKLASLVCLGVVFATAPVLRSQTQTSDSPTRMRVVAPPFPQSKNPGAIAVNVHGGCEFAKDGEHFHSIKQGQLLPPGGVIRTKKSGQLDLYLKKTGVAIRLTKETELRLAKFETSTNAPSDTEVELVTGTIITADRGNIPGPFQITSANGLAVAATAPNHYRISANASNVKSFNLTRPNLSVVNSGAAFNDPETRDFAQNPRDLISQLLEFEEIQSLAETWANPDLGPAGRGKQEKTPARRK